MVTNIAFLRGFLNVHLIRVLHLIRWGYPEGVAISVGISGTPVGGLVGTGGRLIVGTGTSVVGSGGTGGAVGGLVGGAVGGSVGG
jgi:hypothetical protein